ncbi:MAG: hypothetical protein IPP64_14145 [Bacteroidetes bacterium]|nr:hypothetical protein [Bacteroidota bacterium]
MQIKNKLLFVFIFFCFALTICKAKDSTFVFKIALGVNHNKLIFERDYTHRSAYHCGTFSETLKNNDTSSFSPILKLGLEKRFTKAFGLAVNFTYNYSRLNYSINKNSSTYNPTPTLFEVTSLHTARDHNIICHYYSGAIGTVFYINKIYLIPKANLGYMYYVSKTNETIVKTDPLGAVTTTNNTTKNKDDEFVGGGGLIIGYNFKVKKLHFFIEIQSDYYNQAKHFQRNGLNTSLTFGIKL